MAAAATHIAGGASSAPVASGVYRPQKLISAQQRGPDLRSYAAPRTRQPWPARNAALCMGSRGTPSMGRQHLRMRRRVIVGAAEYGAGAADGMQGNTPEGGSQGQPGRSKRRLIHRSVEAIGSAIETTLDNPSAIPHYFTRRILPYLYATASYVYHWSAHEGPVWQRPLRVALLAFLLLPSVFGVLGGFSELFWGVVTLPEWWPDAVARIVLVMHWLLVFWPQIAASALAGAALLSLRKGVVEKKLTSVPRQFLEAGAGLTWLILVPAGIFLGSPNGWPIGLFVWYLLFFVLSAGVRFTERRKWETSSNPKQGPPSLTPRELDAQWATRPRQAALLLFIVAVVGGHWLAMAEASLYGNLFRFAPAWTKWVSGVIAVMLLYRAFLLQMEASQELGINFDRLVVPKELVASGPYRDVRHPIYTSYMLLFAGYAIAMSAPISLAVLLFGCYLYYEQRTAIEEGLLEGKFGEEYQLYKKNTWKYWKDLY